MMSRNFYDAGRDAGRGGVKAALRAKLCMAPRPSLLPHAAAPCIFLKNVRTSDGAQPAALLRRHCSIGIGEFSLRNVS